MSGELGIIQTNFIKSDVGVLESKSEKNRALRAVMKHSGHDTIKAVRKYLREIGYFIIPDWSDLMNSGFY